MDCDKNTNKEANEDDWVVDVLIILMTIYSLLFTLCD